METFRKKCRKQGCSTFGKLNLVGQITAVAAFQQFQLVVTCLVIVLGLSCAGTNSKYRYFTKSVKKRPSGNMDLTGKPFEPSDRKKNRKKILDLVQKKQLNPSILIATN